MENHSRFSYPGTKSFPQIRKAFAKLWLQTTGMPSTFWIGRYVRNTTIQKECVCRTQQINDINLPKTFPLMTVYLPGRESFLSRYLSKWINSPLQKNLVFLLRDTDSKVSRNVAHFSASKRKHQRWTKRDLWNYFVTWAMRCAYTGKLSIDPFSIVCTISVKPLQQLTCPSCKWHSYIKRYLCIFIMFTISNDEFINFICWNFPHNIGTVLCLAMVCCRK